MMISTAITAAPKRIGVRALWKLESDDTVSQLLSDLLNYWHFHKSTSNSGISPLDQSLYEACMVVQKALSPEQKQIFQKQGIFPGEDAVASVLFLSADPTDASRLRLGRESREIQNMLSNARLREKFRFEQKNSVRPVDISQALLDFQPNIVHFSGHGTSSGELCCENELGEIHPILPAALSALFSQFSNSVGCVLLNACYSEIQAQEIFQHIDCVIGMNQSIGDDAAITFSTGFYQAIGAGCDFSQAFELGKVQMMLQNIPEHATPVLLLR